MKTSFQHIFYFESLQGWTVTCILVIHYIVVYLRCPTRLGGDRCFRPLEQTDFQRLKCTIFICIHYLTKDGRKREEI